MAQEEGTAAASVVDSVAAAHDSEIQEEVSVPGVEPCKYSRRVALRAILSRPDGGLGLVGHKVVIGGWVKYGKVPKKDTPAPCSSSTDEICSLILQSRIPNCLRSIIRAFAGARQASVHRLNGVAREEDSTAFVSLQVNDGSCASNLQVVFDSSVVSPSQVTSRGTCILAEGVLQAVNKPGKQKLELKLEKILHIGVVDPMTYPFTKTKLPLDFLRNYSHFRSRTTVAASVARIRNAVACATQTFFQNHGFLYVHTPIITTSDAQGGSSVFQVTTLLGEAENMELKAGDYGQAEVEAAKASLKEKSDRIEELKRSDSNKETLALAVQDLQKTQQLTSRMEARLKLESAIEYKDGKLNFAKDFFSQKAFLTSSSQLHLESYACALGNVYTCGPTFQAEKNQTARCLAETWMVEAELAFTVLEEAMTCAEDYLKFLCQWMLDNCLDDIKVLSGRTKRQNMEFLRLAASSVYERITYISAIELLNQANLKIDYGMQLGEEHERYLTDVTFKKPVILYNYPKELTQFHTRVNDDGKTAAAFNILLPKGQVLIKGSQREERLEAINKRFQELELPKEPYEWYLDLRRHGTVRHSGFSLGFEKMVQFATGLEDARDVIPFPRFHGKIKN